MNSGLDGRRIIRAMLPVLGCFPRFSCLIFACIVQVSTTAPASAEWLLVGGNGKANVYVEEETISRHGEWVSVWVMDDLKIAQPPPRVPRRSTIVSKSAFGCWDWSTSRGIWEQETYCIRLQANPIGRLFHEGA